jgi:hypothetical protein
LVPLFNNEGVYGMPIKFKCPHCQTALEALDDLAGKKRSCPVCKQVVIVPKTDSGSRSDGKETAKQE